MGEENIQDVNTDAASSTESNVDANKEADSSSAQTTPAPKTEKEQTLADVVQATAKASSAEAESEEKEAKSESVVQDLNKTKEEGKEEKSEEKEESSDKEEQKGPIPYERFQEVVHKRDELETRMKEVEPIVQAHQSVVDFCNENSISPEQYQEALRFLSLVNKDPAAAWEQLKPLAEQLQGHTGDRLPTDLTEAVEEGTITLEYAKEIAKLRAKSEFSGNRAKMTEKQTAERQQQMFVKSVQTSLATWEESKLKTDPDFAPKGDPNEPDGKYEWFLDKMRGLLSSGQVKSPQDAVALAEKAYASINGSVSRFVPKTAQRRSLTSSRSSESTEKEPESVADVVKAVAAKHGLS